MGDLFTLADAPQSYVPDATTAEAKQLNTFDISVRVSPPVLAFHLRYCTAYVKFNADLLIYFNKDEIRHLLKMNVLVGAVVPPLMEYILAVFMKTYDTLPHERLFVILLPFSGHFSAHEKLTGPNSLQTNEAK